MTPAAAKDSPRVPRRSSEAMLLGATVLAGAVLAGVMLQGRYWFDGFPEPDEAAVNAFREQIDLNSASEASLLRLDRVGKATAQSIIDYRRTHGPFQHVDDVRNVPRIAEWSLKRFRSEVTVVVPSDDNAGRP